MDGREVGPQVAQPPPAVFLPDGGFYGPYPSVVGRKRDSSRPTTATITTAVPQPPTAAQTARLMGRPLPTAQPTPSSSTNWNQSMWNWDSNQFTARPIASSANRDEDNGEALTLKLGGVSYEKAIELKALEDPAVRPNKRVRSGSLGSNGGGNYPMCQVDDCKADLSGAKDYHRRHKVCEVHSKTTKALVAKQMQRFCQQCSRFHLLSEFDEGKRSCRRRLAGHNRRRRKTQPVDSPSTMLLPVSKESIANGNLDLVNLLALLARLQGTTSEKLSNQISSVPDKDQLIQILSKINALPVTNPSSRPPGGFDLNVSQASQTSEQVPKVNGATAAPSTKDLLAVLSTGLAASPPDTQASLTEGSSDVSNNEKAKGSCPDSNADVDSRNQPTKKFTSMDVSQCVTRELRTTLPLQLFTSAEDNSPPKLGSLRKCLSSESSNPMEERSPSSSPPVARSLFPLSSQVEAKRHDITSVCREYNSAVELSTSRGWNAPLELFKESEICANGAVRNLPYQGGYTSSSGSDHSPSSSNSDAQDRTGRIIFKLFDKDPSSLPASLRNQVLNWLSRSPSDMESYIRPGCVVLSVYASMPSSAWDELEEGLHERVNSLLQGADAEFWRNGRFLVRTTRQLASHKDGKIRVCKSWKSWSAPELTSISPVAIVSGKESSLVLKGRNLTVAGTKIHCTYMGGYISKEVLHSSYPGTIYDDSSSEIFSLPGGSPNTYGRCFVEVENGFKGNSFPVIIADSATCQELRSLEAEFDENIHSTDVTPEDHVQDTGRPKNKEDALNFLNEVGWLFQRRCLSSKPFATNFSTLRFKFMLSFSVERDWCNLVKIILDMLAERCYVRDSLYGETLEMLVEVQLLGRAIKRRCRKMVDLLLHYSVNSEIDASRIYVFPPNSVGPGGLTPLHLAASTEDSEDMVDALTSDPQGVGLRCWNSLKDDNGHSPYDYASMRNNRSYNQLVARKIADQRHSQVSMQINDEIELSTISEQDTTSGLRMQPKSCARCMMIENRGIRPNPRMRGSLLQRPYVHSMLAIAAVCVCVCVLLRGAPCLGSIAPFKWENLDFGPK